MPLVTASEEGIGQTEPGGENHWGCGVVGLPPTPRAESRSCLEWHALEGDSPVDKIDMPLLKRVGLPGLEV